MVPFPASGSGDGDAAGDTAEAGADGAGSGTAEAGTGTDGSGEPGTDEGSVTVDVELPVTWTEDGKAVAHVTYEFNDSEVLVHYPAETWGSGKHILSLYYPIDGLVPNITNTFNVHLRMEGGTAQIGTGGCIASISGQGMAAGAAWDGTVTVEEYVQPFALMGGLQAKAFSGEMGFETMELVKRYYSDSIRRAAVGAFGMPVELTQEGEG